METLTTSNPTASAERAVPRLDTSTLLAYERTRVAYVRTVMAAIRTATSLITFGFTVYKFFQLEMKKEDYTSKLIGPREFGITLILIGLMSLLIASYEYRRDLKKLRTQYSDMPHSSAGIITSLIAALGIFSLLVVLFRR